MKWEGVRGGVDDLSLVGVAVPESGYAGDGAIEGWDEMDERIPLRIAMPSVPHPRMVSVMGGCDREKLDKDGTRSGRDMLGGSKLIVCEDSRRHLRARACYQYAR